MRSTVGLVVLGVVLLGSCGESVAESKGGPEAAPKKVPDVIHWISEDGSEVKVSMPISAKTGKCWCPGGAVCFSGFVCTGDWGQVIVYQGGDIKEARSKDDCCTQPTGKLKKKLTAALIEKLKTIESFERVKKVNPKCVLKGAKDEFGTHLMLKSNGKNFLVHAQYKNEKDPEIIAEQFFEVRDVVIQKRLIRQFFRWKGKPKKK